MKFRVPAFLLALMVAAGGAVATARLSPAAPAAEVTSGLTPTAVHEKTATEILKRLRLHYRDVALDDALSTQMLDQYLRNLDPNRLYFLAADVHEFSKWRTTLDDTLQKGDLSPAYFIFNRYRERAQEHLDHALALLDKGIDKLNLDDDETLLIDRSEAPWAASQEEIDDLWRKRLEDAVLTMKLDGVKDDEIEQRLRRRYEGQKMRLEQSTAEDVFQIYINSLANIYDPHTSYFTPHHSENFSISMSRSLEGIGAVLQAEDEYTRVVRLVPGGPAAKSGQLSPADRIVGVGQGDDEIVNVIGWRLDEVVNLIRGPKGSQVRLEVIPAGSASEHRTRTVSLTRNKVVLEDQAARSKVLEVQRGGQTLRLGVIEVPAFYLDFEAYHRGDPDYTSTTRDVARLLIDLQEKNIDGLVIDLRDNGGGSLVEASQLVSLFIDRGPTVQVRDARGRVQAEPDQYPGMLYSGPMAVLVNRYSASASEIFAGAMQDYGRAIVVGDQTFGKGTVQTLVPLEHGQLKITQAKFYRVSGGSNQNLGIVPDIQLPYAVDKEEIGESALPNALPWDRIRAARFEPDMSLGPYMQELVRRHERRVAKDPEFEYVRARIALMEESRQRTALPLSLKARKAEEERWEKRRLAIENRVRAARGQKPIESIEALHQLDESRANALNSGEELDEPDPWLNESGEILADLIVLRSPEPMVSRAR